MAKKCSWGSFHALGGGKEGELDFKILKLLNLLSGKDI